MAKLRRHSFLVVVVIIMVISVAIGLLLLREDDVEQHFRAGNEYLNSGNHDAAIESYTRAIEGDRQNPMGYLYRGIALLERFFSFEHPDDFRAAIADFNRAIELDPNFVDAYYYRGFAKNYSGEHHQVIDDFTFVIEHAPDRYPTAYMGRGISNYFLMERDAAIADLTHAIELDSSLPEAFLYLGHIHYMRDEAQQALENYQRYLELVGTDAEIAIAGRVERLSTQLSETPAPGV